MQAPKLQEIGQSRCCDDHDRICQAQQQGEDTGVLPQGTTPYKHDGVSQSKNRRRSTHPNGRQQPLADGREIAAHERGKQSEEHAQNSSKHHDDGARGANRLGGAHWAGEQMGGLRALNLAFERGDEGFLREDFALVQKLERAIAFRCAACRSLRRALQNLQFPVGDCKLLLEHGEPALQLAGRKLGQLVRSSVFDRGNIRSTRQRGFPRKDDGAREGGFNLEVLRRDTVSLAVFVDHARQHHLVQECQGRIGVDHRLQLAVRVDNGAELDGGGILVLFRPEQRKSCC